MVITLVADVIWKSIFLFDPLQSKLNKPEKTSFIFYQV